MRKTKISDKTGMPPGTLFHVGRKSRHKVRIALIDYSAGAFEELPDPTIEECRRRIEKPSITWINFNGIHDTELIRSLGELFQLHPLLLEDILNTEHHPKVEDFDDYLFFTFKLLEYDRGEQELKSEQISIVMGRNYVVSFHETPGNIFESVRQRIQAGTGRIRKRGADYLVYALIDSVVDRYFGVIEAIDEEINRIEERVLGLPDEDILETVQNLKKQLIFHRRSVVPLRDIVGYLRTGETDLIEERTFVFFRDVHDHIAHVSESLETQREILSNLMDTFLSNLSNRMNQVMKVLTIIATIFIPLTFIAGVYGMNFKYMPELSLKWAYPALWSVMLAIFAGLVVYFKRNKWI